MVRSIATEKWLFSTFYCVLTWFSIRISFKQFTQGLHFHKSVSGSRLEMLSSEVDSSETSHRNWLKQKLIFHERSHGFPTRRHQLCGYMPRELEKLHNFNMVKKKCSTSNCVIISFWKFMSNTSFNSCSITFEENNSEKKK